MPELCVGDIAPGFTAKDQNGKKIKLSDYLGKKIVLYFYPKDHTPTCTVQARNLRDNFEELKEKGILVVGVSVDDVDSHKKFEQKNNLPFLLLADTTKKIVKKYGVWKEKNMYGKKYMGIKRTSFLINETGTITLIISKPKSSNHSEEVIKGFGE